MITFDNLPDSETPLAIPTGYGGLVWSDFEEVDGSNYPIPCGMEPATISASNVAVNVTGEAASVSSGSPFSLLSAWLTAVWNDDLAVEVQGYSGSLMVYDNTYYLSATQPTLVSFNYIGVTQVKFIPSGGTAHLAYTLYATEQFAMDNLLVAVSSAPQIITQPSGQNVQPGATVSFGVAAAGAAPLAYQWMRNGRATPGGGNFSGATSPTLTVSNVTATDAGYYSVVVTNSFGSTTSAVAALSVYAIETGQTNLVKNGGFEAGTFTNWTLTGELGYDYVEAYAPWIHSGEYGAALGAGGNRFGYLSQTIPTVSGATYLVSFWAENPNADAPNRFLAWWNGAPLFAQTNFDSLDWTNLQFLVSASDTNSVLEFGFSFASYFNYFGLDDVSVTNVILEGAPPSITSQPVSQVVPPGGSAVFSVTALASPSPRYQWQFDGTNLSDSAGIAGSATAALTISGATPANAGSFSVVVRNRNGTASSAVATLSLPPPGQILNVLTFDDLPDTMTGLAVTNGYEGFEWTNFYELDGGSFPGPSGYNAAVVSPSNVVYNWDGDTATITRAQPFTFLSARLTSAWRDGLEVQVTGYTGGLMLYSNVFSLSATQPTLVQFNYTGVNTVQFVSSGGTVHTGYSGSGPQFAMDNAAFLVSDSPPRIVAQPASQIIPAGSTASFSVSSTGTAPLYFQWQRNGAPLSDGGNVSGSATPTLTLDRVSIGDDGVYAVTVTNAAGAAASSGAALTVYSVAAGATNALQNGGFESGSFAGWTLAGDTNDMLISTNSAYAHSGRYGAQLGPGSPPGGSLSETVATVPGTSYQLSFWLDSPDGLTPNNFLISWNGAVIYDQSDLGALGWFNPRFVVQAASPTSVIQFECLDAPSYLGLDDVELEAINLSPSIVVAPASQTVSAGQNVTFSAGVIGSSPLVFSWQRNGAELSDGGNISGSATSSLTLSNVSAANSGAYSVTVTNSFGSAASAPAVLTVYAGVSGASNIVQNGGFETGDFSGWSLSGNYSGSYVGSGPSFAHSGNHGAQLGDDSENFGYGASLEQTLPTAPGSSYLLTLWMENIYGIMPNIFQVGWGGVTLFNQADLPAQGWEQFQFVVAALSSNTVLQIRFEDELAYLGLDDISVSNITVGGVPLLTAQPAGQTVPPGGQAQFNVAAIGGVPLTFNWRFNGAGLADGGGIAGSATSNLILTAVFATNAGSYSVVVTNSFGAVTSSIAPLIVLPTQASLITFDDLAETTGGLPIPDGYHSLTWSNFYELDAVNYPLPGGFGAGVVSPDNVAFNGYGGPATLSGGTFSLLSAWLTAAWNENLEVEAIGFRNGVVVYDNGYVASATAPTLINFNYQDVDKVLFSASGGSPYLPYSQSSANEFVLDNVVINPSASPPQIATQPVSQAVPLGSAATFNVTATGNSPLSYQWSLNGTNLTNGGSIHGATSNALTISNAAAANVGAYSVVVSNSYGAVSSSNATLTLLPGGSEMISFDDLPMTTTGAYIPDGYHDLTWFEFAVLDGLNYGQPSGYGAGVVSPPNVAFNADGYPATLIAPGPFDLFSAYLTAAWNDDLQLEVTGYVGAELAYDNTFTLSATQPLLINFNYIGVNEVNFIASGGTPHLAYGNYPGYEFVMDNLIIGPAQTPPQITAQPAGQLAPSGALVSLHVSATGSPPLNYQWQHNGAPLSDGTNVSGSATPVLTLTGIAASNAGAYSVTVTNAFGLAVSASATISVYAPAAGSSNLVRNGGFETGDFTDWTLSGDTNDIFVTSYAPFVHSGTYGAELGPPGLLGVLLSQSLPTTPGSSYLLSIWLDNPYVAVPNAFQMTWNGSVIFTQQNNQGEAWINPQFIVTASATNSVLLFDVQNQFGAFGLDDVAVSNVVVANLGAAPQIAGALFTVASGQFSFSWTAQVGQSYQVQFATNLANPAWTNLAPASVAAAPVMSASDSIAGSQRFYRVLLLP